MGIARRRFVKIVVRSAVLILPVFKCVAQVVPCMHAIPSRVYPIPIKQLRPDDVKKPGRWGG